MRCAKCNYLLQFILQLVRYSDISKNVLFITSSSQFIFALASLIRTSRVIEDEQQLPNIYVYFHYVYLKLELVNIPALPCYVLCPFFIQRDYIMIIKLYCFCLQNARRLGGKSHTPCLCINLSIFILHYFFQFY